MMAPLALSEEGFVDEHYKHFLSRMEVARSVVKLGYSPDRRDVQPVLVEALMVPTGEPADADICRRFVLRRRGTDLSTSIQWTGKPDHPGRWRIRRIPKPI
jgi:hypothetical protein